MLAAIKRFFDDHLAADTPEESEHSLRLATATLLVEMTRQDDRIEPVELDMVVQSLRERFDLDEQGSGELLALAQREAADATDYHQFTRLINDGYTPQQKVGVIEHLWRVAFADGELDRYEEHMVRKIADLLYVSHTDFIAAKHRVLAEQAG